MLSLFNHALYISNTYSQVFGWTDSTIMQFALWGCLDFPIFFLPAAILLTYSLRGSVVAIIVIPDSYVFVILGSWWLFEFHRLYPPSPGDRIGLYGSWSRSSKPSLLLSKPPTSLHASLPFRFVFTRVSSGVVELTWGSRSMVEQTT